MKKTKVFLSALLMAAVFSFTACSNPSSGSGNNGGDSTPPAPTYSVTIEPSTNGTVTASKISGIAAGETITLTVTPADPDDGDCALGSLSVKKGDTDLALSGSASTKSFTMPEANVTVSATFTKTTYIGSKKPSREKDIGDIVFKDGSSTPYTNGLTFTDEKKAAAIAIIFYKGTELNDGDDTTTSRTLGVGLKHNKSGLAWCIETAKSYNQNITRIQCTPSGNDGALTFTGYKNGSDNLEQIEDFLADDDDTKGEDAADRYPTFYFAKNYSTHATNLGENYASGWYLPSIAELFQIYANGKGANKAFDLDAASEALGGDKFTTFYWSSSQHATCVDSACRLNFSNGGWNINLMSYQNNYVCAIRAFN